MQYWKALNTYKSHRYQSGAEIIEFLVTLPVILIIVGIVFDFGVAISEQSILAHATRASVREVIRGADDVEAQLAANQITQSLMSLAEGDPLPAVIVNRGGTSPGDQASVTINHNYEFFVLPAFLDGIANLNLSATTTMTMMNN